MTPSRSPQAAWLSVPPHIAQLSPYVPGKPAEEVERELGITGVIKVASNENPLGPSPRAVRAASEALADSHLYPDGSGYRLRGALAESLAVSPSEIALGAGSNELIHLLVHAFCRPGHDQVLTHKSAFVSYRLAAMSFGVDAVEAPVGPGLRLDVDALCEHITDQTRLVFVANPNNPTGAALTRKELEALIERVPERALLVIDEAYHEYAAALSDSWPASQPYRARRPSLVTLRTFSKIYGMAGLRMGYGIADPQVVALINRVRRPFHVSAIAQAAAVAALGDSEHVAASVEHARAILGALSDRIRALGAVPLPSLCNFVLVDVGRPSSAVSDAMQRHGVIARPMAGWGLPNHVRVSLPNARDLDKVVAGIEHALR